MIALHGLKAAFRSLARGDRAMWLTAGAVALIVASATVLSSLANAVLWRPLAFQDAHQVHFLYWAQRERPDRKMTLSYLDLQDLQKRLPQGSVSAAASLSLSFTGEDGFDEELAVGAALPGLFRLLGVRPSLGRLPAPGERGVAVLNERFFRTRYGADESIIGQTLQGPDGGLQIVGVLPRRYAFFYPNPTDLWISFRPEEADLRGRRYRHLRAVLRMDAENRAAIESGLKIYSDEAQQRFPRINSGLSLATQPLRQHRLARLSAPFDLLFAGHALLYLIACANLAALLLGRTLLRSRDFAVRKAMGATAGRVIRQVLSEGLVLALAAGAVGTLLAWLVRGLYRQFLPPQAPILFEVPFDLRVLGTAFGLSLLLGVLSSLLAAFYAGFRHSRRLVSTSSRQTLSRGQSRALGLALSMQVSLAAILAVCAALLTHSFWGLSRVDPGFEAQEAGIVTLSMDREVLRERPQQVAAMNALLAQVRRIQTAQEVELTSLPPFGGLLNGFLVPLHGPGGEESNVNYAVVSSGYLRSAGVTQLGGRPFRPEDGWDSPPVAILNRRLAERLWPGQDALGKTVTTKPRGLERERRVVGVVEDTLHGSLAEAAPEIVYVPYQQSPLRLMSLYLRASPDHLSPLLTQVREIVKTRHSGIRVSKAVGLEDVLWESIAEHRFMATLFVTYALIGLCLMFVAVVAMVRLQAGSRLDEMGIRRALGASRGQVVRHLLIPPLRFTVAGLIPGLALAYAFSHLLESWIYGLAPTALWVYFVIAILGLAFALAASLAPALSAARRDPARLLKA
ncbi:MAG TPA: FtsX-like permease family protein [Acidobacteriota bacterium]|nr:FtsX-like permease family protein [Acidobacteriota bacterium]